MHGLDNLQKLVSIWAIHKIIFSLVYIVVIITSIFRFQQFRYNLSVRRWGSTARTSASTSVKEVVSMFSEIKSSWIESKFSVSNSNPLKRLSSSTMRTFWLSLNFLDFLKHFSSLLYPKLQLTFASYHFG